MHYIKGLLLGPRCSVCLSNKACTLASEVPYLVISYVLGLSICLKHTLITMIGSKSKVFKRCNEDQKEHGSRLKIERQETMVIKLKEDMTINSIK